MAEYIDTFFGQFKSYDFFINLGSIIGSIILIGLYFRKNKSWKKTIAVYVLSLAIVELGYFAGNFVRGLSYGETDSIRAVLDLFIQRKGNHFIGRVIFTMWVFPPFFCLLFRDLRKEWKDYLDLLCIFLTFQHAFNRIGCLFNGCCCGKYYNGIFTLRYHVEGKSGPGYAYPVYPTQLFEILCMILLFIILIVLYIKKKRLLYVFITGFSVTIFLSEFMMNKQGVVMIAGLTVIQYAAVLLLFTGIVMAVRDKYR